MQVLSSTPINLWNPWMSNPYRESYVGNKRSYDFFEAQQNLKRRKKEGQFNQNVRRFKRKHAGDDETVEVQPLKQLKPTSSPISKNFPPTEENTLKMEESNENNQIIPFQGPSIDHNYLSELISIDPYFKKTKLPIYLQPSSIPKDTALVKFKPSNQKRTPKIVEISDEEELEILREQAEKKYWENLEESDMDLSL